MKIRMGNGLLIVESEPPPDQKKEVVAEPLTESEKWSGRRLLDTFLALPEDAQVEVFAHLKQAFMRRGGRFFISPNEYIVSMADVFSANGHELEEYT